MSIKNPIHKNDGFICKKCKAKIPPQTGSCRNHCTQCLYSLHVDKLTPGDRENSCHGLMRPFAIDYSGKKGIILIHECIRCGMKKKNKTAPDDNFEAILRNLAFADEM